MIFIKHLSYVWLFLSRQITGCNPDRVAQRDVLLTSRNRFNMNCRLIQPPNSPHETNPHLRRCAGVNVFLLLVAAWVLAFSMANPVSADPANAPDSTDSLFTSGTNRMASLDNHHKISVGD